MWSRVRLVARVVGLVLALGVACGAWSVATPLMSAPDDSAHLAAAWGAKTGQDLTGPTLLVPRTFESQAGCHLTPPPTESIGTCVAHAYFPVRQLKTVLNTTAIYPPYFHRFLSRFFGPDLTLSLYTMRWAVAVVSVVLIALPLLLVAMSRRDAAGAVTVPLAIVLSPLAWFFLASTNPSAWEIAGALCSWGSLVAVSVARRRVHVVLGLLGIAVGLAAAAVSRPGGGVLTAVGILFALPIVIVRRLRPSWRRRAWWALATAYTAGLAVVVWLALQGTFDIDWGPGVGRYDLTGALTGHNLLLSPRYVIGQIGPIGWLRTDTGPWAELAFVAVAGYVVLQAYRAGSRALSLLLTLSLTAALLAAGTIATLSQTSLPEALQSRYIWGLAVAPVFVALIGMGTSRRTRDALGGHVRPALVAALSVGSSTALAIVVSYYSIDRTPGVPIQVFGDWQPAYLGTAGCIAVGSLAMTAVYALCILPWGRAVAAGTSPRVATSPETTDPVASLAPQS